MPKKSDFKRLVIQANNILVHNPRKLFNRQEIAFHLDISPTYAYDLIRALPALNQNIIIKGGSAVYIGKAPDGTENFQEKIDDINKEKSEIQSILSAKTENQSKKEATE
jgi:hypothetical protein